LRYSVVYEDLSHEYPRETILNWPPSKGNSLMFMHQSALLEKMMLPVGNELEYVMMAETEIELAGGAT